MKKRSMSYPTMSAEPQHTFRTVVFHGLPYLVSLVIIAFGASLISSRGLDKWTNAEEHARANIGSWLLIAIGILSLAFLLRADFGKKKHVKL